MPLVEAMEKVINCFMEVKRSIHSNFNDNVSVQRMVTLNQNTSKRDLKNIKQELIDEMDLRDVQRDSLIHR